MRRKDLVPLVAAALLLAGVPQPGRAAQGPQSSVIEGRVFDSGGGVLVDAVVRLSGPTLIGGPRVEITDAAGRYRFAGLPRGEFEVTAEFSGMAPAIARGILVPLATTATVDLTLALAAVAEHIETHATAVIDGRTPAFVTTLDNGLLQHVPTSHRTGFQALINLAPGVTEGVGFGGTVNANAVYIDGLDATEPRRQEAWLPIGFNWLQEATVTALAGDVRYGDSTGVTANFQLRAGGDRLAGLAEYWTTAGSWIGRNQPNVTPRQILAWWDASAQSGGPLVRERLWFFTGFEYHRVTDRPPGFSGPGERAERTPRAIVKLNAAPASAWRAEGFVLRNRSDQRAFDVSAFTPLEVSSDIERRDVSWNARTTWSRSPRVLVELRSGGYTGQQARTPHGPGTREGPSNRSDRGVACCNAFTFTDTDRVQGTAAAVVTALAGNRAGRLHQLDAGVEVRASSSVDVVGFPAGVRYIDSAGAPFLAQFFDGERVNPRGRRLSLYAQDRWTPHEHLSVTGGVRVDVNRGSVPQRGRVFGTTPVSPRAGVAWDVGGRRRTVVKGHYGRFHDPLLHAHFDFMDTAARSATIVMEYVPGSGYTREVGRSAPAENRAIDTQLSHAFVDQFTIGVERQAPLGIRASALYVRRNFRSVMAFVDTGSNWAPVERLDPGPDNRFGTPDDGPILHVYQLTNPGQEFLVLTNPDDAFRHYDAVQFMADRRGWRGWQLQASYTWSRNRGTVGNRSFTNSAGLDTGEFTGSGSASRFLTPNGTINADGRAPFDYSELKLVGWGRIPAWGGVNAAAVFRWFSGARWERHIISEFDLRPNGFETIYVEPRGSRQLPAVKNLDLRIEKTVPVSRIGGTVGVFADVFNATNQATPTGAFGGSGRNFGLTGTTFDPRTLRVAARLTF